MSDCTPSDCPFCRLPAERVLEANALAVAVADVFPVTAGHTLVIPRRHVSTFFELTAEEVAAVYKLLRRLKHWLEGEKRPDGYNVGVNVGSAAGQTLPHVHVHLIPRYVGDVADPVGGVRNVLPGKGRYTDANAPTGITRSR